MTVRRDSWMLDELADLPSVRHCLVVSADGLPESDPDGLDHDDAQRISAACAAVFGGATALREPGGFKGGMRLMMIQYDDGYLLLQSAGDVSRLAVLTDDKVDPGLIAQEMTRRVAQIGKATASTPPLTP
jgi:predicted regulator of Ras-like GTPase activity (Roadblock/LC7/MglB family)